MKSASIDKLKAGHVAVAEGHMKVGKLFGKLAAHHQRLASEGVDATENQTLADLNQGIADGCADLGQAHVDMCQAMDECEDGGEKLMRTSTTDTGIANPWTHNPDAVPNPWAESRDFTKVKPDGVHGVLPGVQLVNRTGGAPLPVPDLDADTALLDTYER